jgi:hypothetical protein
MVRQGTRGCRREPEGIRQSLLCGGVVQLVRTPVTQEAAGSSPVAPANSSTGNFSPLLSPRASISQEKTFERFAGAFMLLVISFCAQSEHAIRESYAACAAKDYRGSGDSERGAKIGMTMYEDSRDPETDSQYYAHRAIHSPNIKQTRHPSSSAQQNSDFPR